MSIQQIDNNLFEKCEPVKTSATALIGRLQRPILPVDVVIDTDTYNEVDDQYALAYLIANADKLHLKAIYAAPFQNQEAKDPQNGMEKSYAEIKNILHLMRRDDLEKIAYQGSTAFLNSENSPVISDAAQHLAHLAMQYTPEHPLYVIAIAAITNIASALLINPAIRDRIVVIWLGGHALHWHDNQEFNLKQDIAAARVVLGGGTAVVLIPCKGVVSAFSTTEPELRVHLKGKNELCDYLFDRTCSFVAALRKEHCWSKSIWDITAVGWLLNEEFMLDEIIQSPIPEYDHHWGQDKRRHPIRYVYHINRDQLFEDLFDKLSLLTSKQR